MIKYFYPLLENKNKLHVKKPTVCWYSCNHVLRLFNTLFDVWGDTTLRTCVEPWCEIWDRNNNTIGSVNAAVWQPHKVKLLVHKRSLLIHSGCIISLSLLLTREMVILVDHPSHHNRMINTTTKSSLNANRCLKRITCPTITREPFIWWVVSWWVRIVSIVLSRTIYGAATKTIDVIHATTSTSSSLRCFFIIELVLSIPLLHRIWPFPPRIWSFFVRDDSYWQHFYVACFEDFKKHDTWHHSRRCILFLMTHTAMIDQHVNLTKPLLNTKHYHNSSILLIQSLTVSTSISRVKRQAIRVRPRSQVPDQSFERRIALTHIAPTSTLLPTCGYRDTDS